MVTLWIRRVTRLTRRVNSFGNFSIISLRLIFYDLSAYMMVLATRPGPLGLKIPTSELDGPLVGIMLCLPLSSWSFWGFSKLPIFWMHI